MRYSSGQWVILLYTTNKFFTALIADVCLDFTFHILNIKITFYSYSTSWSRYKSLIKQIVYKRIEIGTKGQLISVVWKLTVSYGCMHQLSMNVWQMGKNKQKTKTDNQINQKVLRDHTYFSQGTMLKRNQELKLIGLHNTI